MNRNILAGVIIMVAATLAGCGGSSSSQTALSGVVADGYLKGAEVFLDMNGNYQWDAGEPKATTTAGGHYTLMVSASDAAKYPVMVRAIAGTTIDEDTGTPVTAGYVMSAPAGATAFVSPMTSLLQEKLAANPGMTLTEAMVQLRNQLNLSAGFNLMGDYVAGSQSGANTAQYQTLRVTAQQMVELMAQQQALVMNGSSVNLNRYRSMMGTINANLPAITANATGGMGMDSSFMLTLRTQMQTQLQTMATSGFMNFSSMFRNMTSQNYFWNYSGGRMQPGSGMMM